MLRVRGDELTACEQDNYNWVVDNAAKLGKDAMLAAGVYGNLMQATVEGFISGGSGKAGGSTKAAADDKAQVKERMMREIEARQKAAREAKWRQEAEAAAAAAAATAAAAEHAAASEPQQEAEPTAGDGGGEGAIDDSPAQVGGMPSCEDFDMFDCSATHEYSACLARKEACEAGAA